jgi:hypothetical protein
MGKIATFIKNIPLLSKKAKFGLFGIGLATTTLTLSVLSYTGVIQIVNAQVQVTFLNYDNSVLETITINRGETAIYRGEIPSRPGSDEFTYVFSGWNKDLRSVQRDLETTAVYLPQYNAYQATFYSAQTQIWQVTLPHGSPLVYGGQPPQAPTDNRFSYEFAGWDINGDGVVDNLPQSLTSHIRANAVFVARLNSFVVSFTQDGKVLGRQDVYYGASAEYNGKKPFKLPQEGKHFVFDDWKPSPDFVTSNMTVVADFKEGSDVPYVGKDGNWMIGNVDTMISARANPENIPFIGENGNWNIGDIDTDIFANFANENTPYPYLTEDNMWAIGDLLTNIPFDINDLAGVSMPTIGENGNLMIGDFDTGIKAILPGIGENDNWMIGLKDTDISALEELLGTPFVGPNGNWWIGQNDTGIPTQGLPDGFDLELYDNIPFVGPNDNWWIGINDTGIAFDPTTQQMPYIGANDHWWIGEVDTYISAHGLEGETPYPFIGENGNWWVNETDTGIVPNEMFSNVPFVGLNGDWWFGPQDTGIPAIFLTMGVDGSWTIGGIETGIFIWDSSSITPYLGENGNWWIGAIDTGIVYGSEIDYIYAEPNPEDPTDPTVPGDGDEEEVDLEIIRDSGYTSFGFSNEGSTGGLTGGGSSLPLCPAALEAERKTINVKVLSKVKVYDGQPLTSDNALIEYDATQLETGETIVVDLSQMYDPMHPTYKNTLNVGQYALRGLLSVVDSNNEVLKCKYILNVTEIGSLIINPRTITINTSSATKEYDGTPLTSPDYTVTGMALADNDFLVVELKSSQTEVGATPNSIDWVSLRIENRITNGLTTTVTNVTQNYIITNNFGFLVVTPKA